MIWLSTLYVPVDLINTLESNTSLLWEGCLCYKNALLAKDLQSIRLFIYRNSLWEVLCSHHEVICREKNHTRFLIYLGSLCQHKIIHFRYIFSADLGNLILVTFTSGVPPLWRETNRKAFFLKLFSLKYPNSGRKYYCSVKFNTTYIC